MAPTAEALLAFLAGLAWKGSLVLALAFVLARLAGRRSAALRHGVWTLAVVALLALPAVQAVAPPLPAPLPFALHPLPARVAPAAVAVPDKETAPQAVPPRVAGEIATPTPPATTAAPKAQLPSLALLVVLAWALGALAVTAFFATGKRSLGRLARRARPIEDESWRALVDDVAARLGLSRLPRLLVAEDATAPLTWGSFRPTILLPARAVDWSTAQRRSFLVHELGHVARRDCAIQDAAHLACALYWFHPGAWYAAHRLRVEREPACDDLVLADGADAEAYASQLLSVVRNGRVPRGALSLSGAAMAAPSRLEARVRALLDEQRDRRRVGRGRALFAMMVAFALVGPLAALVPVSPTRASSRASQSSASSPSTTVTDGVLDERWQHALDEGPGEGSFWFAYAIDFDGGEDETLLSDSGGWSADDLTRRGAPLSDRLGCDDTDAVILVRLKRGGGRTPAFDRVALRNARYSPDLGGLPVVAVGKVPLDESLDWLIDRFDETPDDQRASVLVKGIALHGSTRTVGLLEGILDGRRESLVRSAAAEGLSRHPGKPALSALVAHAREDRSNEVRAEAAESIGDLDYAPATDALIALVRDLSHGDESVRAEAVESLGEREPARVIPILVELADDADASEHIRREAVETLGDLPDNAGLESLRRMAMRHPDRVVRDEAVETLNEMGVRAEVTAKRR